ncbi:MAG: hypothetical protein HYZ39_21475 [Mycolicibacterium cosmeticum]|nr:hypothetical protein [Mycolicibacterium cosmeticum]
MSTRTFLGAIPAVLVAAGTILAPHATAASFGNFDLIMPDRVDFHTWIWSMTGCLTNGVEAQPGCVVVTAIPQPVARAFNFQSTGHLVDGRFTMTVDDPFGLRCGNVYYGPTSPTHDVYSWDAVTLAGTLTSSFDAGCDGAPGTVAYPFSLARL